MDFDIEKDFKIFDALLEKRPEISPESLKTDLKDYYLPYLGKLLQLKTDGARGMVVGISAIQGVGKTTQGEILEILLKHFRKSSVSLSIDDHYITHAELTKLRNEDPRFIRRGVTHDIPLAIKNITDLINFSDEPVLVAGYDKGVQHGDGDRLRWINPQEDLKVIAEVTEMDLIIDKQPQKAKALNMVSAVFAGKDLELPENMGSAIPILPGFLPDKLITFLEAEIGRQISILGKSSGAVYFVGGTDEIAIDLKELPHGWRVISEKPDFIFYDGWMLGARKVADESIFASGLPALETEESQEFARFINNKLPEYDPLWALFNFMNVLYVPDYQISIKWRDQAEEALRAKGAGMSPEQIVEFVHYFWRSVHPAIQIKNLAFDSKTNQVVIINDNHTIKEVVTPEEAKMRYP